MVDHQQHDDDEDTVDEALAFMEEEEEAEAEAARLAAEAARLAADVAAAATAAAEAKAAAAKAAVAPKPDPVGSSHHPSEHEEDEEELVEEEMVEEVDEVTDGEYEDEEIVDEEFDEEYVEECENKESEHQEEEEVVAVSEDESGENGAVDNSEKEGSTSADDQYHDKKEPAVSDGSEEVGGTDEAATVAASEPDRSSTPEPAPEAAAPAGVAVVTPSSPENVPTEHVESSPPSPPPQEEYTPASPPAAIAMMTSAAVVSSTSPPPLSPPQYSPPSPPPPVTVQQPKRYVEMPPPSPVYIAAAHQQEQQEEFMVVASPLPSPRGKSGRRSSAWVEDEPTDEMGMRMNEINLVEIKMQQAGGPPIDIHETIQELDESKHPDDEPHDPLDEYIHDREDDEAEPPQDDDDFHHEEEEAEAEAAHQEEEGEQEVSERTDDEPQVVDESETNNDEEQHQEHQYGAYDSENNEAKYKSDDAPPEEAPEQYEDEYASGPPTTDYSAARDVEAGQEGDANKKRQVVDKDDGSHMGLILCALICFVMLILAIIVGVVLSRRNNDNDSADKGGVAPTVPASWPTQVPVAETEWPATLMPSFEATPAPIGMVEVQRFSGSADDPGFGSAVALAGDVLVIGAKVDGSPGSVNIYQKTNPARWLQEEGLDYFGNAYGPADRIVMSDFAPNETQAEFGTSVDLAVDPASTNVDGSGLVVGAPGAYMEGLTVNAGAAYFFLFNLAQSAWLQHGSAMRGGTELTNSNEQFGAAVATSNNLRVVVGAPGNNDGGVRAGRVYIFEYKEIPFGSSTQLDWVQVLPEPFLGQGEESLFGASVDINPTGDVIAIGEPGSQSFTILERDQASGNWTQTFQLPIREVGGSLGSAVKILSADFIAVGASQAQEGSGSVRLYQKFELGVWEEYGEIFYGEAGDQIGASGSLDGALGLDGPVIVVGASNGAVKRLDFVNERWFLVTETESGSAISAVAYSPDSNTILAGKSTENTVGFYEEGEGLPPTNSTGIPPTSEPWQESTTPPGTTTPGLGPAPPDVTQPPTTSPLGTTQAPTGAVPLATLEPTAVAGATVSPTLASTPLSSESGWQVTHGPLSGPQAGTGFGKSVSLGTNLFATGLPSLASGSVQTSSNVNGLWTSLDDLSEVNATQFGASVDLITGSSQTSLLVGAPETVDALFLQPLGAAFFYELSGSAWVRLGGVIQPVATPEEVNGKFGAAVAAAAGRICVGAPESNNIDDSGTRLSAGRVYTFTYDGTDWQEGADQVFGFAAYDRLGASMAMTANGAFLLVGAPGPGTANGVVSYYAWSGSAWLEILSVTGTASESLGASVAIISEDGSRIALGGPTFAGGAGVVRVYSQGSGSYTQLGSDIVGSLEDKFGTSLTGSNGRVVVGSSQGGFHAYDFDSTIGDWVEVSIAPVTSSAVTGVSTTGDATTVLVGLSSEEVLIYDLL